MKTTLDMSSYEIEQDEIEFDEEIMSDNWDPADELVCGLHELECSTDVSTAASIICMRKMYSFQH